MGTLGKPQGIFRLDDSDHWVGSYILRTDLAKILGVEDSALEGLGFTNVAGEEVIDENVVHKALGRGEIPGAVPPEWRRVSLNEFVVAAVAQRAFPSCEIQRQVRVRNPRTRRPNTVDFQLDVAGHPSVLIEFDGPSHFIPRYRGDLPHPLQRKEELEQSAGVELIVWPYWMHVCTASFRALFEPETRGVAALWSTNAHFGDFTTPGAAAIIETITERFNAVGEDGYGYLYEADSHGVHKPAHPIVQQIRDGRVARDRLIPNGAQDPARWLPTALR